MKILSLLILAIPLLTFAETSNDIKTSIAACPKSPNCVSSLTSSEDHKLAAIDIAGSKDEVYSKLRALIKTMPRTEEITLKEDGLHFTFTSFLFRFTDDVWFFYDEENKKLHFKSQSRVGYSDLGANKKRMENIRKLLK